MADRIPWKVLLATSMVICCAGCHGRAIREIHARGGDVLDWGFIVPDTHITFEDETKRLSDKDFREIFPYIRQMRPYNLDLSDTDISDQSLPLVRKLHTLKSLSVEDTRVTGRGLESLSGFKNLDVYVAASDFDEQTAVQLERNVPGINIRRVFRYADGSWTYE